MRTHPITKQRSFHTGVDLDGDSGDAIVAFQAGKVSRIDVDGIGRGAINGHAVHVSSPGGRVWSYLHLLKPPVVKVGDQVDLGQLLGAMGKSGRATGEHLHLQLTIDGKTVDPLPLIPRTAWQYANGLRAPITPRRGTSLPLLVGVGAAVAVSFFMFSGAAAPVSLAWLARRVSLPF